MQNNMRDHEGEEKNIGIHMKPVSGLNSTFQFGPGASVLQELLAASKDAEMLIACLFELHSVNAEPLQQIWIRLAAAIDGAQLVLHANHLDGSSVPSRRECRQRRS